MADKRKRSEDLQARRKARLRSAAVPTERSRKTSRLASPPDDATMTDKAYALIEELIVTLELAPGAVLSEVVLANRLSTGRTPVREALQRLSRDGLVNILPRRGVLVIRRVLALVLLPRELQRRPAPEDGD